MSIFASQFHATRVHDAYFKIILIEFDLFWMISVVSSFWQKIIKIYQSLREILKIEVENFWWSIVTRTENFKQRYSKSVFLTTLEVFFTIFRSFFYKFRCWKEFLVFFGLIWLPKYVFIWTKVKLFEFSLQEKKSEQNPVPESDIWYRIFGTKLIWWIRNVTNPVSPP
jgi:hypothetical protein